jgi:imidazolonepropionase-like amidohydrolase
VHIASDTNPGGKETCLPLFIANGVTGVRDMGGDLDALQQWRREIAQGRLVGPRIVVSGPMLDGPIPAWPNSLAVATAPEGREAVVALKQQGADFVKVQSLLPRDAYFAVAEEAKKQGLPLAGHVPDAVSAAEASDVGQRSMEHLFGVPLGNENDAKTTALFASFAKNDTWHCPRVYISRSYWKS